ncbi:Valine--tRNA ligase [Pseudolycoriella hygida]|uniref:Valine--tRNA ligase n=1 Tax=Pseudolycoriella hygida TaxID=35572 RepID=A0A9Q0N4S3_9DIPT|nr:Valine--tRNA ligase [Pseudolycoriella hygida]
MNFISRNSEKILVYSSRFHRITKQKCSRRMFSHKGKYIVQGFSQNDNYFTVALASAYQSNVVESNIRLDSEFTGNDSVDRRKFSLILPPPNVTGDLHLGHAMMSTIQDVLARWKRSRNFDVTWIPGTDHAGIATQVVVEKMLKKAKNVSRHDIGRNEFLNEVWKWRKEKAGTIRDDLTSIGASLDWSKEYFTMDEAQSNAVSHAFVRLYNQKLIYRGKMLVNWSCALESTISDIEVENVEVIGPTRISVPGYDSPVTFGEIFEIAYKICDTEEEIIIATTRPETLLGDVAVAVHPDDARYANWRESQTYLWHPFRNEKIPLIFDDAVDKEFGTGAVKITPAHDKFDYDMAIRHSLPAVQVINGRGEICKGFGEFSDQKRFSARDLMKNELSRRGLLRNVKSHKLNLPVCMRSKDIVELLDRPQWFVRCEELARNAIEAVETGEIRIHPENYKKEWIKWLSPCRDWCISRQLWWGHQVPAYECTHGKKTIWLVGACRKDVEVKAMRKFQVDTLDDIQIVQDPDVLDTWFSSALLPFSAMGWPRIDDFYDRKYPLDLMVTGHDILFFWVARMVMLGQVLTGRVPFTEILLHGVVCDANGRKMSKSLGNVIRPQQIANGASLDDLRSEIEKSYENGVLTLEEVKKSIDGQRKLFPNGIPQCGMDALRFTLCSQDIKSHFVDFDVNVCHANSRFFNKIWQAARYTITSHERMDLQISDVVQLDMLEMTDMDRYILSRLGNTLEKVDKAMNSYNLHLATGALKSFFYADLCDVYLETTKKNISDNIPSGKVHCHVLASCLSVGLKYMSFFTPFLSKELQRHLSEISNFKPREWIDDNVEMEVANVLEICSAIRQLKNDNNIVRKHDPIVHLFIHNQSLLERLHQFVPHIVTLGIIKDVKLNDSSMMNELEKFAIKSTAGFECSFGIETNHLFVSQTTNSELNIKKLDKLEKELAKLLKTVSNEGYLKSSSPAVQAKHNEKIRQLRVEIESMKQIRQHG